MRFGTLDIPDQRHSEQLEPAAPGLAIPLLGIWLLSLVTFSMPDRGGAMTSLDWIALLKVAVRLLAMVLMSYSLWKCWRNPLRSSLVQYLLPWMLFVGWAIVSTAWSPLKSVTLGQAGSQLVLIMLALNLALAWKESDDTSRVLFHLSLMLLLLSGFLLLASVALPSTMSMTRSSEGIFHATNSAATGALGIVLLVASRFFGQWSWARRILLPGLALHGTVVLISANRMSLAITLLLVTVVLMMYGNRLLLSAAVLAGSVLAALYLASDPGMTLLERGLQASTNYASRGQTTDQLTALSGRGEMWEKIWASYLESPWIGHGYFVSSSTGQLYVWYHWSNWTAHNFWLQTLVSTGLIGMVLMLWALLGTGRRFLVGTQQGWLPAPYPALLLLLATWYAMWGLSNESFVGPLMPESLVFYSVLALGLAALVQGEARQQADDARRDGYAHPQRPTNVYRRLEPLGGNVR